MLSSVITVVRLELGGALLTQLNAATCIAVHSHFWIDEEAIRFTDCSLVKR